MLAVTTLVEALIPQADPGGTINRLAGKAMTGWLVHMAEVEGTCDPRFEAVREVLAASLDKDDVGASVAVNKLPGIRGGMCHDTYSAHQGVEHDNINVLVLGSRVIGVALAHDLVQTFMGAKFTNEERHVRRLGKVKTLETKYCTGS